MDRDILIVQAIEDYPILGEFLSFNDIDCVTCAIKTCRLKDILDIHNFSKVDQVEMYAYMEKLINNETTQMKKFIPSPISDNRHEITKILMEEHTYIKELIYTLEYIIRKPQFMEKYKYVVNDLVHYIKVFADDTHHGKEEQLLFSLFKDNDAVKVMLEEHDQGRDFVRAIKDATSEEVVKENVIGYTTLLKEHIHKEDDILFPYLDRMLQDEDADSIDNKLKELDNGLKEEVKKYLENFMNNEFTR